VDLREKKRTVKESNKRRKFIVIRALHLIQSVPENPTVFEMK
jgi:hypothetical protein